MVSGPSPLAGPAAPGTRMRSARSGSSAAVAAIVSPPRPLGTARAPFERDQLHAERAPPRGDPARPEHLVRGNRVEQVEAVEEDNLSEHGNPFQWGGVRRGGSKYRVEALDLRVAKTTTIDDFSPPARRARA